MLSRPFRKTLRFYRNRLSSLFASDSATASLDDYPRRGRATRHRRLKRRRDPRPPLGLVVVAALSILLAAYIALNRFIPPAWRIPRPRLRSATPQPQKHAQTQAQAQAQTHTQAHTQEEQPGAASLTARDALPFSAVDHAANASAADIVAAELLRDAANNTISADAHSGAPPDSAGAAPQHGAPQPGEEQQAGAVNAPGASDAFTRTCYHNPSSDNMLCVHSPLCMRQASISYLSETLNCAAYTTSRFVTATLSRTKCVALERRVEAEAEISPIEHKSRDWLSDLEARSRLLWFPRDAVLIRLPPHTASIPQLAARLLMLHHLIHNARRYGLHSLTNVVIAAHPTVARKLRAQKSWHHGLLSAVIHPHAPVYSHAELEQRVARQGANESTAADADKGDDGALAAGDGGGGELVVFVSNGMWGLSKARRVPCFRRVALPAAARSHLLLPEDDFPGEVSANALTAPTRFRDAHTFRAQVHRSLGGTGPPPGLGSTVLYLHRSSTRTLTAQGHALLQARLQTVASVAQFELRVVDTGGMGFREQVEAMSGASVVVGVHGTQMLNGLFLAENASVVEIFPFSFANAMVERALGPSVRYEAHTAVRGEHFGQLGQFGTVRECLARSADCRRWYQSDGRAIEFTDMDVAAVAALVERSIVRTRVLRGV